jgi:hypothetical protein
MMLLLSRVEMPLRKIFVDMFIPIFLTTGINY